MWACISLKTARHQRESLLFFHCLSHSTSCLCLLNNHVVWHRQHAACQHTRRDEKSALAVNGQPWNTLSHQFGWRQTWERLCVRMCVWHKSECEYIKSVRYQQSTIHQMNKNNRSNPDVILLLRLWCHDVIGNNSSLTTKCFFGYKSEKEHRQRLNAAPGTDNKNTHIQLTEILK